MSKTISYEEFAEQVNTKFRLSETEEKFEIELVEATAPVVTAHQEIYSLFFKSPKEYFLPQRTYELEHERLGDVTLFLVPVEETEDGFRYESVFNLLIDGKN